MRQLAVFSAWRCWLTDLCPGQMNHTNGSNRAESQTYNVNRKYFVTWNCQLTLSWQMCPPGDDVSKSAWHEDGQNQSATVMISSHSTLIVKVAQTARHKTDTSEAGVGGDPQLLITMALHKINTPSIHWPYLYCIVGNYWSTTAILCKLMQPSNLCTADVKTFTSFHKIFHV